MSDKSFFGGDLEIGLAIGTEMKLPTLSAASAHNSAKIIF